MDKETRSRIQRTTQETRRLLEHEYGEQLEGTFDILPESDKIAGQPGSHLDAGQKLLREKLVAAITHKLAAVNDPAEAVQSYLREAAFTTLNRFVALKMLEARGLVQECISRGEESSGFKEFSGLAPGLVDLPDHGYRLYIDSLFDEIAREVKVLFDRRDPASLLWPHRQALLDLLAILNAAELKDVWGEDETIGWFYQYFNSDDERRRMRAESQAPRNSRELAVRNQFFTPRYVVEFLTDNTLGRIWYEMRKGNTRLADRCRYLVRRPTEIFLDEGQEPPQQENEQDENLSQEGSLKQPVYIPHRAPKDPRDLKILDPACGSGHFLLYAFDLLVCIYAEAWADPQSPPSEVTGNKLRTDYSDEESLHSAIPSLILRHNLHGIDIDPRCGQIAALALWMRAQRAYNDFGLPRDRRTTIDKTNIVVAEPMPGDKDMVREFTASLQPKLLGQLVEVVFDKMQLAGEAGSLLKIEEEIAGAVEEAKRQWLARPKQEQMMLFDTAPEKQARQARFDFSGIGSREFWNEAETRIYRALQEYTTTVAGIAGYRRRLFAEDASQGFAFVDLCRQKYDVVLMNPPFGDCSAQGKIYVDATYGNSRQDLFAAFVDRALGGLVKAGLVGVISTEAGFFRRTLEPWRRKVLLERSTMSVLAHLGGHVLDGATVRTACYALQTPATGRQSLFLRLLGKEDREARFAATIEELREGKTPAVVFATPQSEFEKLPYAVFGYWCSPELRNAFVDLPKLEENVAHVRVGLQTSDDFRFLRLRWEVAASEIGEHHWLPFAKGGEYSPFHDDVHLVVKWEKGKGALIAFAGSVIRNSQDYMKPGLTYPLRTNKRFSPRTMPANGAFSNKGPSIVNIINFPLALLALLNSRLISYLLSLAIGAAETEGGAGANSYEVGLVQRLPVSSQVTGDFELKKLGREAWQSRAEADLRDETTALFNGPFAPLELVGDIDRQARNLVRHLNEQAKSYIDAQRAIDKRTVALYGFSSADRQEIEEQVGDVHIPDIPAEDDPALRVELAARLLQFLVGVAFGRWNPAALTATGPALAAIDPFAPVKAHADHDPSCPAILADDPGHEDDLVNRLAMALQEGMAGKNSGDTPLPLLWEDCASHLTGTHDIRPWLRSSLFGDHIKRYSKSRRKAPIYWQLSTSTSSYSVWLYYHRFTRDTFYRVLSDYVAPKLQHEEQQLADLRREYGPNPTASQRKDIDSQEKFVEELRVFREEVARIAPLWKPDLDDGVIINFAPLWRLVPQNRAWQKECQDCWDKLAAGDYDWAHLAMHLWPERVVPKCREDRSLAIAHGLEDEFWQEDDKGKWQPREVDPKRIGEIIADRTSPLVKNALAELLAAPAPEGTRTGGRKGKKKG